MSTVRVDLLEGETARKTANGWEFDRQATVYGIADTLRGYQKAIAAVTALIGVVGDIGEPHPEIENSIIKAFDPKALASDHYVITITYGPRSGTLLPDETQIEVGSSLSQVESNKDANGNAISLQYAYPANYPDPQYAGRTVTQGGMISRLVPESTLLVTKKLFVSPGSLSRLYVGKVNAGSWGLDVGAPARRWLCVAIVGRSGDSGFTWEVQYNFAYRFDGWDESVFFVDPVTGHPPADLLNNVGIKLVQKYTMIDFNGLNLP